MSGPNKKRPYFNLLCVSFDCSDDSYTEILDPHLTPSHPRRVISGRNKNMYSYHTQKLGFTVYDTFDFIAEGRENNEIEWIGKAEIR